MCYALEAGLEPATVFRQQINSLPPATNSGTPEHNTFIGAADGIRTRINPTDNLVS